MSKVTLLDCTLRDGGYYNDWCFDHKLAQDLIASLNKAGVDIIEVGYKAPKNRKPQHFEGLFRYCTESQLTFLEEYSNSQYAFMIDTKEFLVDERCDVATLKSSILPAKDSLFDWVRVASHFKTFSEAVEQTKVLSDMGYQVGLNLMGISLLNEGQLEEALRILEEASIEVFYFADSFGNLHSSDIVKYIETIRNAYSGKLGIHTHDNQGLAFSNTLQALQGGIDFVDSTIMGMGRGAGNLKTEQLLLHLYFQSPEVVKRSLVPSELLDTIDQHFVPLHKKYQWGWDYTYMLSALQNIHPTYCQSLRSNNQFTIEQVSRILNDIEESKRPKYNEHALTQAIELTISQPIQTEETLVEIPSYNPDQHESILVLATGPSLKKYQPEICEFIRQNQPLVIECNPVNMSFQEVSKNYLQTILNWVRLQKAEFASTSNPVITGLSELPNSFLNNKNLFKVPCHVGDHQLDFSTEKITIPAYVVGMFSVCLALLSKPEKVYLAGYDGYSDTSHPKHQEMEIFWKLVEGKSSFISITPSTYSIMEKIPVYQLIQ